MARTALASIGLAVSLSLSLASVGCASETADPNSEDSEVAQRTTLTFFLEGKEYDEKAEEWKAVPLDSLNPALEAAGLQGFHKAITVGAQDGAKFQAILDRLEEANKKLHRKIEFDNTWDPSDYKGLCYNGTAAGVMKTVDGLRGSAFSEYMGVQGYRYGTRKKVFFWLEPATEAEWLRYQREENDHGDTIKAWEKFDTRSDAFLMMTDGGQQGDSTELFAVLIPRCR
jgi:hypothetical protein